MGRGCNLSSSYCATLEREREREGERGGEGGGEGERERERAKKTMEWGGGGTLFLTFSRGNACSAG